MTCFLLIIFSQVSEEVPMRFYSPSAFKKDRFLLSCCRNIALPEADCIDAITSRRARSFTPYWPVVLIESIVIGEPILVVSSVVIFHNLNNH